ncbi:MAG: hypothetical protein DMF59_07670 [Acidobacteria bacterium]|nr:MAG: hypothetical protein DMF59_07670 [Acidobacteriota bacterium]
MRKLIVTADDVGLDRGMTTGAIEAHRNGIVTACSIVANGREFDDAVARLREVPSLEVGVHLTLVEERALTTGKPLPRNWARFLLSSKKNVESELRAQIERNRVVRRLASEYGIHYVRVVNDHGGRRRRLPIALLNRLAGEGRTIGVAEAGHLTTERIVALLDYVSDVTELVAHPGVNVLGYAHWKYDWDAETRALCDPRVREAVDKKNVELIAPSKL